jgi:hypothetical protein
MRPGLGDAGAGIAEHRVSVRPVGIGRGVPRPRGDEGADPGSQEATSSWYSRSSRMANCRSRRDSVPLKWAATGRPEPTRIGTEGCSSTSGVGVGCRWGARGAVHVPETGDCGAQGIPEARGRAGRRNGPSSSVPAAAWEGSRAKVPLSADRPGPLLPASPGPSLDEHVAPPTGVPRGRGGPDPPAAPVAHHEGLTEAGGVGDREGG